MINEKIPSQIVQDWVELEKQPEKINTDNKAVKAKRRIK